ncbi:hypothetical protein H9646_16025 [Comamonas sp. Sa2CVA6]|uniref:Uncharacterized protein n=2 Tax=Comamonas avium TaxID=2762231 RepID=A0ABR8SER8_9BURK|nr:hypothetical protein [Comamonas avium]
MPLTKTDSQNPIRGLATLTMKERGDCQDVIAKIEVADLGRGAGTLHTSGSARLDLQGKTANGSVNLQVQIGTATAAAALIAPTVLITADDSHLPGIKKGVISVLNQSLDSGTIWNLTGTLP